MPQIIFAFAFNPENKEAVFSGNVEPVVALKILQDIVIADLVKKSQKPDDGKKPVKSKVQS